MSDYTTAATALRCKECERVSELTAAYVCEYCFGPLEARTITDRIRAAVSRERIATGPLSLWRYRDSLPCAPEDPAAGLQAGLTPLVRAPRLAAALGLGDVWVKNDTANPTHSPRTGSSRSRLPREGARPRLPDRGLRLHRQPQRRRRPRLRPRPRELRLRPGRPRGAEDVATAVYGTTLVAVDGVTTMSTASAWSPPPTAPGHS